jgi:TatD DNase family protein
MTWLFDSHIHLSDPEYESELPTILRSMETIQIKACCVSVDYLTSQKTLELSKKSKLVLPFLGMHPGNINDDFNSVLDLVRKNSDDIIGIGEIGLDKTYSEKEEDFQKQELVFKNQLSLAEKLGKPISIHSRKALDEIFEIIPSYSLHGKLLHWFDGSKKQLKKAMDLGFYVSYGPVLVYAKDKQVLLSNTELERILVETDGPVKFSKCFEQKSAQISFIPSVVFCVSKVLRETYDDISLLLEKNSMNFLGI